MITDFEYEALKRFRDSKDGITCKEFAEIEGDGYTHRNFNYLDIESYITPNYSVWMNKQAYILSEKGADAIVSYEKCLNHPHECKHTNKATGVKYVIVEHRSGCFCTGVYHLSYTSNIGFTRVLAHATLYDCKKDAEKALEEAIKNSPTKYQNPKDYEFSIEEVELTVKVQLPKTYVCKDCGKVLPIKDYYISTYCPNSWNTGVCTDCQYKRKRKEREAMYGRNSRGVYDYDSLD